MISIFKKKFALIYGLIIFSNLLASDSFALSCSSFPDIKQAFQESAAVFHGKVISADSPNEFESLITFEVIKSWGGVFGTQVIINNRSGFGNALYPLSNQGAEFIVYADVSKVSTRNNPIYYISPCGRGVRSMNPRNPRRYDPDKEMEELDRLKKEMDEGANSDISWIPITSHDRVCTSDKAYNSSRFWVACWDIINNGWDGPDMVVIPEGGPASKPFAIGRNEITMRDWSRYCTLSGNCKSVVPFYEPMTGISWGDAEKYVQWLSERTGNIYRLPTMEEWKYAAIADGELPSGSVNCQTALNGKNTEVRGTGWFDLISGKIISGIKNNWGLKNYIGNVQEWVASDDAEILALGGHYNSNEEECDVNYFVEHNGEADEVTGFRVLMEIQ